VSSRSPRRSRTDFAQSLTIPFRESPEPTSSGSLEFFVGKRVVTLSAMPHRVRIADARCPSKAREDRWKIAPARKRIDLSTMIYSRLLARINRKRETSRARGKSFAIIAEARTDINYYARHKRAQVRVNECIRATHLEFNATLYLCNCGSFGELAAARRVPRFPLLFKAKRPSCEMM